MIPHRIVLYLGTQSPENFPVLDGDAIGRTLLKPEP